MQDSTSSVKVKWTDYMEKAESHYLEDTAAVENGKKEMEKVLQNWYVTRHILELSLLFDVDKYIYHPFCANLEICNMQCAKG